ncbi:unknown [Prevotella sp. CAG:1092]|nr:unknown [Prevotella sp. CAG:1092]
MMILGRNYSMFIQIDDLLVGIVFVLTVLITARCKSQRMLFFIVFEVCSSI